MDIILTAGLWLKQSIWDDVAAALRQDGHTAIPVALPGADDGSAIATLEDQVGAVVAAVDASDRPMVVGHSAACTLAWIAGDQRPDAIHSVVLIGGFPAQNGETYADIFEPIEGVMGFPGWEPFEGPDSADLDDAARRDFAEATVAVPVGVSKGVVRLSDARRYELPVLLVCPEYNPEQAKAWIDGGDVPELEKATNVSFVNIDTGHWPMVTQPAQLARILTDAATNT